jgi:hypothetical protein
VQQDDTHPVAKVLPTAEQVRIKLPDQAGAKLAAVGETARWYVATRDITRTLNGGTAFVLALVHTVVQFPPTTTDGATAVWGPHHDALDPAEWRLTVTELADGTYDWKLEGHSRTEASAPWETLIDGNANGDRTGSFHLDFDAAERVNPRENDGRGQLDVTYDIPNRALDIGADGVEDRDGTPTAVHYDYAYDEAADGAGDMVFQIHGDTEDAGHRRRGDHAALALARHRRRPRRPARALGRPRRRGHRVGVLGHDVRPRVLRRLGELAAHRGHRRRVRLRRRRPAVR